ncbi:aspartate kinase [Pontivivens nitratireducens]|uniref:Aspartokinase n=1 Tax=Pontivivens nitratireducens TaxID=2758038 RepID=A0A6G7VJD3_9RHOB|nr:aspartate kinase [Pontibrevibacter nitratireducens]QIK39907.1 aspartate kinase [Pontibrevibacter nitratireducens]
MSRDTHTVEKIGGTSMSRSAELLQPLLLNDGGDPYGRIFVVSAYGGITDMLLEHKKTGEPGVYAHFANAENAHGWSDALNRVAKAMGDSHCKVLSAPGDIQAADDFVRERIEGARSCLIDLQRLCSYGHFRLSQHMGIIRELLAGLGESHSAYVTTLLLRSAGVNARFVDLSGWRDDRELSLDERIEFAFRDVVCERELPIVTGYAQCTENLMSLYDRGYSEVTFSRLAAQTGAAEAIIHKEFHLSSADPKLVGLENVNKLGHTNYDVADQLSNMGMEAIHPSAAKTLRQAGIPLRVTNAFEPSDPGTLIDDAPAQSPQVEILTSLDVFALEVFEQDMVGVKGYDATILQILTRHNVDIVSKTSNANSITHYVDASPKLLKRVENDLAVEYPTASVTTRGLSVVAAIGRDLSGLNALGRGFAALERADIELVAVQQGPRNVDIQFVTTRDDADAAVRALHHALIEQASENRRAVRGTKVKREPQLAA